MSDQICLSFHVEPMANCPMSKYISFPCRLVNIRIVFEVRRKHTHSLLFKYTILDMISYVCA